MTDMLTVIVEQAPDGGWRIEARRRAIGDLRAAAMHLLAPDERARCDAMTSERAADLRRAAYVVRREAAGAYMGRAPAAVTFGDFRAPLADGTHVSLSHTAGAVAVAFARAPVGVDIERIHRGEDPLRLAARYFAPEEADALRALPAAAHLHAFLRRWTAKEALMKATGVPLRVALCTAIPDADACDAGGARIARFVPSPGYVCAVALCEAQPPEQRVLDVEIVLDAIP